MTDAKDRYVIIPAGGSGTRMGLPYPKQLLKWGDRTVLECVLDLFEDEVIVLAVPTEHEAVFRERVGNRARIVLGGSSRYQSVRNAFEALQPSADDLILIHDAARPFLDRASLKRAWLQARADGALVYAAPATDTIKLVDDEGRVCQTPPRNKVYHAQTPQITSATQLRAAYQAYDQSPWGEPPTDEAGLLEWAGFTVSIFPSTPSNRKITHREDLHLLQTNTFRTGHGYDVHRFDPERPLYLGGILIPDAPGLAGHSDADVAIHALIDALLGAAGRGDIGHWFPDNDEAFKGIRSTELLKRVWADLSQSGYALINADLTLQAQAPRLAPHLPAMRRCLAEILQTDVEQLNIKATTTEGLGFVGRKEGMAAHAVALLTLEVSP